MTKHPSQVQKRDVAAKVNKTSFPSAFSISKNSLKEMIDHCKQELPFEACGLISGKNGVANKVWKMKNINRSPVSFAMDITEIQTVFEHIAKRNESLMGIYHSHPSDFAYPSKEDIAYHNYPLVHYLIVSFSSKTPEIKCYEIKNNKVNPFMIKILD